MPNFDFKFERTVTTYETVHRVIEAATLERAQKMAALFAADFNSECPDDAMEVQGAADFGGWASDGGETTDETADYRDEDADDDGCAKAAEA